MPLITTRRTGLVDQVIGQMRQAITDGEWPVGQRIPTESALMAELSVSRNTVREAVRALSHAGLLEVRQGDGTFVIASNEIAGAVRRLCGSELREVLEVRRSLEVEGARLAATTRSAAQLRKLTTLLNKRERAAKAGQRERFIEIDVEFHRQVVQCSGNALLTELYLGLTDVVTASLASTVHDDPRHGMEISHDALLDAIAQRDPERAAREAGGFLDEMLADLENPAGPRGSIRG